ncbi:MAG: hypothetical protein LBH35_08775 [Treponema sp.]|jgi:hypothetical protein|nr:hypothetical protein [Treponema sp.]
MKKPLTPRFLLLVVLYALIFVFLVNLQFAGRTGFTHRTGNLVVQGNYGSQEENPLPNSHALDRGAAVFFGGMEFDLGRNDKDGFALSPEDSGVRSPVEPELLVIGDNGVSFRLAGETALSFVTRYSGGALELVIEANFSPGYSGLEIPFRPLRTSRTQGSGPALLVNSDGVNYTFGRGAEGPPELTDRIIRLTPENRMIRYRAISERRTVSPENFILAAARSPSEYEEALTQWRDKSYSAWNRAAGAPDSGRLLPGEAVNAYMSEALKRGTYRAVSAALAPVYVPSPTDNLSFEASAYTGKLDSALRSLSLSERERYSRLARLFNERSADFLKEFHVVEFLGVRGLNNLLDDAADMLRSFDPAAMTIEQSAGFFEGNLDWERIRPGRDNPYERFLDQAFYVTGDSLKKDPFTGAVLAFSGNEADTALNLRLGSSLSRLNDETRRALGRSIVLSVLSLADDAGSAPRIVVRNENSGFDEKPGVERLSSAGMYRICRNENGGEYYAGARSLSPNETPATGLWAWTAASNVSAVQGPGTTDITVSFPAGETHYMIIRGLRPFAVLQLYGIDYPSDPQFERYDSSGWAYSPQEQTLLLKMRHRSSTERIRILYNAAPVTETGAQ